ncbi:hypothetical protein BJX61DRAFT_149172 [Aspergillus egyptiacus]|nr:hypothetical protein BJX61DRAFT_149172 [Aspergillus egyptiacus]
MEPTVNPPVTVTPIRDASPLPRFFDITAAAFGHQAADSIWTSMNPLWDTPPGRSAAISRLTQRLSSTTTNRNGDPNTVFLQATVPTSDGEEEIAGVAIWVQSSVVPGFGDPPTATLREAMDLEALYPGMEAEQRYLCQVDAALHRRRGEVVREVARRDREGSVPAVWALDLCAVDPKFQRRGVAMALVERGLEEARRRGGLEAVLEASSMGRHVYSKLGFVQEGGEIEYDVDEEFRERERPSNVFMRTGKGILQRE